MASVMRNLPHLVVLMWLVSIRGFCPMPTTSGATEKSHRESSPSTYDEYDYDYTSTPVAADRASPNGGAPKFCDYRPCREKQTPCVELAASTGCFCPGFTLYNEAPLVPDLRTVSWNGSDVVARWCAPNSYVTAYVVTVGGEEKLKFGSGERSGAVGQLDHIVEVCVSAVNDAGNSKPSCMMYQPRDIKLPLTAGIIGGALGLLLLLLLVVLLWRRRRQRKLEAGVSMGRQ